MSSRSTNSPSRNNSALPRILGAAAVLGAVLLGGAYGLGSRGDRGDARDRADRDVDLSEVSDGEQSRPASLPPISRPAWATGEPASDRLDETRPEPSPREHRDQVVSELRASGPDRRHLAEPAKQVGEGWSAKLATLGVDAELGRFECHAKGCFMTAVHKSETDVEKAMQAITRTGEFHGWQSGKMRSGVIARSDGKVEVTWVLYSPQADEAALAATLPADTLDELTAP
jgi:hypothetical protein